jgi:hypothetical protein
LFISLTLPCFLVVVERGGHTEANYDELFEILAAKYDMVGFVHYAEPDGGENLHVIY